MIRFKRLTENITEKVEDLKEFLKQKPDIIFAYLFGGLTKGKPSPLCDVDIAVYVKDPKRFDYLKFYGEVTDFLDTDDLNPSRSGNFLIFNILRRNILKRGIRLVDALLI